MSERFFVAQNLAVGQSEITDAQVHHIRNVMRLVVDDQITVFDGTGRQAVARISMIERNRVVLEIQSIDEVSRELAESITVAMPIPKGDRARFLVEKLTEIGVAQLIPVKTQRSVFQEKSLSKLDRYVIEACKQCGRNKLMEISPTRQFTEVVNDRALPQNKLILDPRADANNNTWKPTDVAILVGPEGGFTDDELELASENDWQSMTLGPSILRMETAAIVAVARVSQS